MAGVPFAALCVSIYVAQEAVEKFGWRARRMLDGLGMAEPRRGRRDHGDQFVGFMGHPSATGLVNAGRDWGAILPLGLS